MFEDKTKPQYGFFRAQVVNNRDDKKFGRIMIWVPDLMPKVDKTKGIWAMPANNPIGGLNTETGEASHNYCSTCYIPRKGSYVWIFFENGNINKPFYFSGLDLQNTKVLPECQVGSKYEDKWVILKSHDGRCIVMSDDPDDCRVEITGKKRKISSPPTGDTGSVYTIDGNQTTILLDERSGKQKILIRSYNGDFINFDIEERKLMVGFNGDIEIATKGKFKVSAAKGFDFKTDYDLNLEATGKINIKGAGDVNIETGTQMNQKSGMNFNCQAGGQMSNLAGGPVASDGASVVDMGGLSQPAGSAGAAATANPKGGRDD